MQFSTSEMRRAIERYLSHSTSASRCLLVIVATIPYMLMYLTMHGWGLSSPEVRAGLHVEMLWAVQGLLGFTLCALVGLALWLWPRQRDPAPRPWAEFAVAMLVGEVYTTFAILVGPFSAGPVLVLMGISAVGLLLFQWRVMMVATVLCSGALLVYDALMLWFDAPYGPAITVGAFAHGASRWWLTFWQTMMLAVSLPVLVVMITLLFASQEALHRRLRRLSTTDDLTGLVNRHHFMGRLTSELARQQRSGQALSLVLLDADHFKRINDVHGHATGDEVLVVLAQALSASVRAPTDLVGRLGGEEFAILLPDTALVEAEAVCTRLQHNLRDWPFPMLPTPATVTVSMGVVQSLGFDAEAILRQADANLYRAKAAGRNQAVYAVLRATQAAQATEAAP